MSEMNLYDFIAHLPEYHKCKLQFRDMTNHVAKYLEVQQEVWKLRKDLESALRAVKFVAHIEGHLNEGDKVICTICKQSIDEINHKEVDYKK